MKIICAGLSTETNCFAPFPTTYERFVEEGIWRGNVTGSGSFIGTLVAGVRDLVHAEGHRFVEGLFASAQPAGPTTRSAYESLRDVILDEIEDRGPFDVTFLFLHGAMVADGYDDCEGDLLGRLRARVGSNTVVGAILDPHCHLTPEMVAHADILVCAKEYPHTDYPERMSELYRLCTRVARGEVRPTPGVFDCRMIGFYPTTSEPMSGFVRRLESAEDADDVLSVSFVHGFELGDTADTGSKMLVYTDNDPDRAREIAEGLGTSIYRMRSQLLPSFTSLDEALARIESVRDRVVLADVGDNPGAGFAADNMGILRALLGRRFPNVVAGCYWDPVAAGVCAEAGVGARLTIRVGGKSGPASGPPLDIDVVVRAVKEDHVQDVLDSGTSSFGRSVWLHTEGVDLVVTSRRCQVYSQDAFSGIGIDLSKSKIITLKSGQHFHRSFSKLTDNILYVAAPDTIGLDLKNIPHHKLARSYFPRVDDPLELDP